MSAISLVDSTMEEGVDSRDTHCVLCTLVPEITEIQYFTPKFN